MKITRNRKQHPYQFSKQVIPKTKNDKKKTKKDKNSFVRSCVCGTLASDRPE